MKTKIKKKTNKKLINFLLVFVLIVSFGFVIYLLNDCWSKAVDKSNRVAAIKVEQSKENVKIAEKMVEKELNISSKYFEMINRSGNYFSYGRQLDSNIGSPGIFGIADFEYWIDNDLKCEVQVNGESYSVIFETQKVDIENEEIEMYEEMYEPIKINKIIKNVSN
ncbi:hypothetical protein ACTFRP_18575 [Bacillus cereus group sp. MYBK234-1]|uniref:hypothetical protein n=1 Tax=unclassified Bacillus cereus group TaxID=2750818 RepID=UPI002DB8CF62|nr:hypothetical protein [Bacillus cereus]MEB9184054.1 hypothetical protein [Bacillus cereus]